MPASANNQAPEISAKEVSEQNYNISIECSLNYDINLDDSARATIYLEIENLNKNDLFLEHLYLKVQEVPGNITNVKVESPRCRKSFKRSDNPCFSRAKCFQNLRPYEYCYNETKASNTTRYKCFCVAINKKLGYRKLTNLYIFYSTDKITDRSKNNTKYLFVPLQRFDNFWVRILKFKYEYSRDNIFENESGFLRFLKDELDIGWAENAEISEYDDGKNIRIFKGKNSATIKLDEEGEEATLKISDGRTYYLKWEGDILTIYKLWVEIPKNKYLFSWDNVPGNDRERLLRFLKDELDIGWAENAEISEYDDGKNIRIFKGKNSATIKLDEKKEEATLKIHDGETYYLKWGGDKLTIYKPKTNDKRLQAKGYNILINFPQDRHHYSQLKSIPHPYPDVTSVRGNSPTLSWHFDPNNRNSTRLIIPAYQIQKDRFMIALDTLVFIALTLTFIGLFFAVKDYKHKWILRVIFLVIFVTTIAFFLCFLGLTAMDFAVTLGKSINWLSIIIGIVGALFGIYIWFYDRANARKATLYIPLFLACRGIIEIIKDPDKLGDDRSRNLFASCARTLDEIVYKHGSIIHLKRVEDLSTFLSLKDAIDENVDFVEKESWADLKEKFKSNAFEEVIDSYANTLLSRCKEEVKELKKLP